MRCLNEPIARRANQEDNVSGHFWESRFKSQALLDEAAIIAAMAYVDLNPIRAAMAETPEESDFTSIQQRILEIGMASADQKPEAESESQLPEDLNAAMGKLMPFRDQDPDSEIALPANLQDYIELIDWTGRCIAPGKRGSIPENLPPILTRLNIRPENYIKFIKRAEKSRFHFFIGPVERIREVADKLGRGFFNPDSLWPGRSETWGRRSRSGHEEFGLVARPPRLPCSAPDNRSSTPILANGRTARLGMPEIQEFDQN